MPAAPTFAFPINADITAWGNMRKLFADAESYYDTKTGYSLSKLTPPEYILDARWETIGWSIAIDDSFPVWMEGDELRDFINEEFVSKNEPFMFISHNALFDALILSMRYGIVPAALADTLSMSRALISHKLPRGSVSLKNVGAYFGLEKGDEVVNMNGLRLAQIKASGRYEAYQSYGKQDTAICREIFRNLAPAFPVNEFLINDMVIRMAAYPQFQINETKLFTHKGKLEADKQAILDRVGLDQKTLGSNELFATALRRLGVELPMKESPSTGKQTYAFAKTDKAMTDLAEHPDHDVQALIAARLKVKSTIEESRTQRFIDVASATRDENGICWMPVALKYGGAHTHRFSGDWKLNQQNIPPGSLRESLEAPEGCKVVACDASQIEARLTAYLCGQWDLLRQFADGLDPYSLFASDIYGEVVTKKDKEKRLLGKISLLALGFGMGDETFMNTVRVQSAKVGTPIIISLEMAARVVALYRSKYPNIPKTWRWLGREIPRLASGASKGEMFGPMIFDDRCVWSPDGMPIHYENLRRENGRWKYDNRGIPTILYDGKWLENIVQNLDRVAVMEAALRVRAIERAAGWNLSLAHQVHDEIIYIVPDDLVSVFSRVVYDEMAKSPEWAPDLPLGAEVKIGQNYGDLHEIKL
ncbi:DNA polymerase [Methylocystis heyeri]|nr:DNA polymerase [Methylocystis heyeri]